MKCFGPGPILQVIIKLLQLGCGSSLLIRALLFDLLLPCYPHRPFRQFHRRGTQAVEDDDLLPCRYANRESVQSMIDWIEFYRSLSWLKLIDRWLTKELAR